ncbi:hypothetical protein VTN77DRAFT_5126 [Rasamsonia byssochlamydoides]|uniref:uncharacterized protein n=1 Tax=Rasamsonia byssochlamydoides TaxID=89139 RepID=UPI0037433D95
MTEDQDLLAKISQLAGQINKHKNRAAQNQRPNNPHYSSRPPRGGWAPYRVRGPQRRPITHRNRTLVLNNSPAPAADKGNVPGNSGDHDSEVKPGASSGWVAKRDRHIQLINSAIYNKEAQARAKAIAETQRLKAERRAKAEEAKVMRYVHGNGRQLPAQAAVTAQRQTPYQILVNDIPFQVARGGSKLIRISNDPTTANATPKRVTVGGVTFVRSKTGNLHRLGAVVSKRKPGKVKKRDELCKRFSRTGTCYKGPACPYIHNPDKVAICKEFLQTGKCRAGESCDLSHEPSPHRSPVCVHFLRGRCSNPDCRYSHVRVTPGAPVCRAFAVLGYCEKGAECQERHVYECPDYANTGTCNKRKCTLPHVDRAGQIRKNAANRAESPTPDGEEEDISSDEEEYDEIDSDDVDSDELDDDPVEVIEGGAEDSELSGQQDFVHF